MHNHFSGNLWADDHILQALKEDISHEDLSTNAVVGAHEKGEVELIAKEAGILAGLEVFCRVFQLLDPGFRARLAVQDGDRVEKGRVIARLQGTLRALLSGERTALNYLQRMSGIATYTRSVCDLVAGSDVTILDTRKTTPTLRSFEKYAVRVGGGRNHRYNLSDAVMLKDNHIAAAGGVKEAVARARAYVSPLCPIEVEAEDLAMVQTAAEAGADIIMLDNMTPEMIREAVRLIAGRSRTEISGNVTRENISRYTALGIDYISLGALTHSAPILDLSLKNLKPL